MAAVAEIAESFSKLNPLAKEFVPSSKLNPSAKEFVLSNDFYSNFFYKDSSSDGSSANQEIDRKKNGYNQRRRRRKFGMEDSIRRTVYVSDVDNPVTEVHLAKLFANCGQVVDCRVCGDPHSILRFAFIEFAHEDGVREALKLDGTMLGYYPIRVLPSDTAILPVNPKFLPQSDDEREMVVRTVYCTNIDKKVTHSDVKVFFEQTCGEISRLRLLGDNVHLTGVAFVEFVQAESATAALSCSGVLLGALPIRVSPSKTPVRPRIPCSSSQ